MKYIYFLALSVVFLSTTQSAYAQPAIEVWYGATQITDNQPSTVLLGTGYQGTNLDNTMQIRNTGTADLNIFSISVSGFNFSYVGATPPFTISAGGSRDFTVRFYNPGKAANTGAVLIETSIIGDNTFAFQTFARLTGPEVDVTRGTSTLPNSIQSVSVGETHNYGNVMQGASGSQAFSIHNTSPDNTLTISNVNVSGDFTLSSQVGTNTIATNSKTTFSVTFNTNMLGSKSGSVSFTTNDADEPNYTFPLAANVILPAPTTQATDLTFSNVTTTSMTVDWSNGNGVNRIVVAKEGSAVDAAPDDNTSYNAAPDFGVGAEIGSGNFVVYNGNGSSVDITNLNPKIFYHFQVFEYNGSTGTEAYNTSVVSGSTDRRWAGQSFVTRWNTSRPGTSGTNRITIPTVGGGYNYDVDWEEVGTPANNGKFRGVSGDAIITFPSGGNYEVEISGNFPRVRFDNATDARRLSRIMQWGDIEWSSMEQAFVYCEYLDGAISDSPDLSDVTSTFMMFQFAAFFDEDVSSWNMSNINNMEGMFAQAASFNNGGQPLDWGNGTAAVTNMEGLFTDASAFNQDVSDWNVSNVTNMSAMFWGASSFNRDISNWDVRLVTDMSNMLTGTTAFRNGSQPLDWLNTGMVTNMDAMFSSSGFNQDISGWDVSNVLTMNGMFRGASNFNQPLAAWDISSATNMTNMFDNCNMSMANYEATLLGWADDNGGTETINSNVTLGALNLRYTNNATGRQDLISTNNWNIIGDILLITPPTTQATDLTFTNVSTTTMTVSWVNGDGANRIVVAREDDPVDAMPVDGTNYTANPAYRTTGTELGIGNFVVYNGTGSTVDVTGLNENTTYHFQVFEYNGTAGTEKYNMDTNPTNPLSEITNEATGMPPGLTGIYFDGIDDYVEINIPITVKLTYEVWCKGGMNISSLPISVGEVGFDLSISNDNHILGSIGRDGSRTFVTSLITIDRTVWNHIALTYDGATLRIYLNGNIIGSRAVSSVPNAIRSLTIGSTYTFAYYKKGQNDEVKIWDVARTSAQIQADMYATNPSHTNLIGYWSFDDDLSPGNQTVATDASINGFDGTLTNNPLWVHRVVNTDDTGVGSLREAIASSNTDTDKDYIDFSIPTNGPHTIQPSTDLDNITSPLVVDGTTQQGISNQNINLDGQGTLTNGLSLLGDDNEVYGLNITDFTAAGVLINHAGTTGSQIGDPTKGNVFSANDIGVLINTSTNNVISANNIEDNTKAGIELTNGGNGDKNAPVISAVTATIIYGTCENGDVVEIFNDAPNGGHPAQGRLYLGTAVTTGTSWNYSGSFTITDRITATATAMNGTSVFSPAAMIVAPTTQATDLTFTNVSTTSMTVNWTNGNGANRIVVAREGGAVNANPADNSAYTANAAYGTSTSELGSGNFVVFTGAGNSVGITNLTLGATYHFQVFEYNGTAGTEKYNLDTNPTNPLSESTIDLYTVINTDNSGVGSLRQAIINANASSGETITFKIPGGGPHVITPTTALPAITSPMTIDGYSQPGASVNTLAVGSDAVLLIEIDGVNINGEGLFINNISNCVIQGLSIHSFDGYGIGINGSLATNNSIRGCYIGVKTDGVSAPFPTTRQQGLQVNGAPNNFIGDGTAAGRNVISGNGDRSPGGGIDVNGSGSTGNQIQGNYIGVDLTGLINVGNYGIGVEIRNGASGNTVGGTNTLSRNIISGNQSEGINFNTGSLNIIIGNYIGVGADGISSIPNQYNGINVANNSTNNQIGGTAPGEANLIANNNGNGIEISSSTSLYNTISGNTIYSNSGNGISLSCGNNNKRFPVITTTTAGTITGTCESGDIIEVFDAGTGDEGQTFLGTAVTSGSTWNLSGSFNISNNFTATATSANGSTSEFSRIDGSSPPGLVTPTTQVDGLTLSSFTGTSASLTWANGNGSGRLIVASTSPITWTPIDGMAYTANSTYGSGVPVDTDTYVVYSGSGSSSSISGLTVSFAYYFKIFEFDVECSANYYNSNTTAGNSMITPPSGQATNLTFTNESTTSMTVNWTNGDGANRIVVAREGNVVDFSPVDGQSYTADPDLTTSTDLGSGNFVVYNGAGSSVGVTGLYENTTYHFQVFEYNGTAGSEIYNVSTATDNPANQITLYREISVFVGAIQITTGDTQSLASTVQPNDASLVFTINNTGTADLTVTAIDLSDGSKYSISGITFPNTIAAGSAIDFTLTLDGSTAGTFTDQLTIVNNDPDFVINPSGTITDTPIPAIELTDGSTTLATNDNYTLTSTVQPNDASQVFTINNTGTADLIVTAIDLSGGSKYTVSGITFPNTIAAGSTIDFTLTLDGSAAGTFTDELIITNNDADFVINLLGTITATPVPAIEVTDGSTILETNANFILTSSVQPTDVSQVITINNMGTADLIVTAINLTDGSKYSVSGITLPNTIAAGSSADFILTLDGSAAGTFTDQLTIANNDTNFVINLSGTITDTPIPAIEVTDGSTILVTNDDYTLTSTVQPKDASQVFTINNTGTADLIVTAINMTDGSKYTISGITLPNTIAAGSSADFILTLDGSAAGTFTDQLTIANNDTDFVINLSGTITVAPTPTIEVTDGSTTLVTNDNYTLTSTVQPNDASQVFTINNTGTADLTVTAINLTDGSKYSVSGITFPNTIAAGSSTDFTLTLDSNAAGTFTDQLTIANNDIDFEINLIGTISEAPSDVVIIEGEDNSGNIILANEDIDMGVTLLNVNIDKVFVIENLSVVDALTVNEITVDNPVFEVLSFSKTVPSKSFIQFTIRLNANTIGAYSTIVHVMTSINDFSFVVVGEVNSEDSSPLEIFNVVTPNGDGIHDFFNVKNLQLYPDNILNIYNRWGDKVFEMEGYDNVDKIFVGMSNTSDGELITGSYFYSIDKGDGSKVETGYLFIKR